MERGLDQLEAALTETRLRLGVDPGPSFTEDSKAMVEAATHDAPSASPPQHQHQHQQQRHETSHGDAAEMASFSEDTLRYLQDILLASLLRVPGYRSFATRACPILFSSHTTPTTASHTAASEEEGEVASSGEVIANFIHSPRALSLCSSSLSLLAELERAQRRTMHGRAEAAPTASSTADVASAGASEPLKRQPMQNTLEASVAREEAYVQAAVQLQHLLLVEESGIEATNLAMDDDIREDTEKKANRKEDPPANRPDTHPVRDASSGGGAGKDALGHSPRSPSSSSSSSALFGPSVPAGAARQDTDFLSAQPVSHATVPSTSRSPIDALVSTQQPQSMVVDAGTRAGACGERLESSPSFAGEQPSARADNVGSGQHVLDALFGDPVPVDTSTQSTAEAAAAVATSAPEHASHGTEDEATTAAVKTIQKAWTDTQLLQAALRRGVGAADGGHMSIAANDFALIVKLLFKKCFVVEELVLDALQGGDGSHSNGGKNSEDGDGSVREEGGGLHSDRSQLPAHSAGDKKAAGDGLDGGDATGAVPFFDPDAITMSMLPPGLDEEDYEEERKYLEAKRELQREPQQQQQYPLGGAMDTDADTKDGTSAAAWVLRALAKVNPDALPLATLQAHCHLTLPDAYMKQQQFWTRTTTVPATTAAGPGPAFPSTSADTGTFLSAAAATADGGNDDDTNTSATGTLPPEDTAPLAALMPALKTSAATTAPALRATAPCRQLSAAQAGSPNTAGSDPNTTDSPITAVASNSSFSLTALFAALLWNVAFTLWEDGYLEDAYQWLCTMDLEKLMAVAAAAEAEEKVLRMSPLSPPHWRDPQRGPEGQSAKDVGADGMVDLVGERTRSAYASYRPAGVADASGSEEEEESAAEHLQRNYAEVWHRAQDKAAVSWERLLVQAVEKPTATTASSPSAAASTGRETATNLVLSVGAGARVPLRSSGASLIDMSAVAHGAADESLAIHEPASSHHDASVKSSAKPITSTETPSVTAQERECEAPAQTRSEALWCLAEKITSLRDLCALAICCESSDDMVFLVRHLGAALLQQEALRAELQRLSVTWKNNQRRLRGGQEGSATPDEVHEWVTGEKDECMADILLMLNLLVEFFLAKRARQLASEYASLEHKALASSSDSYFRQFGEAPPTPLSHRSIPHPQPQRMDGWQGGVSVSSAFPATAAPPNRTSPETTRGSDAMSAGQPLPEDAETQESHQQLEHRAMRAACDELVCAFTAGYYFTLAELDQGGMPTLQDAQAVFAPGLSYILATNVLSSVMNYASLFRLSRVYCGVAARETVYKNKTRLGRTARLRRDQYPSLHHHNCNHHHRHNPNADPRQQQQRQQKSQQKKPLDTTRDGANLSSWPQHSRSQRSLGVSQASASGTFGGTRSGTASKPTNDGSNRGFFGFVRDAAAELFGSVTAPTPPPVPQQKSSGASGMQAESPRQRQVATTSSEEETFQKATSRAGAPPTSFLQQPARRRSSFSLLGTPLEADSEHTSQQSLQGARSQHIPTSSSRALRSAQETIPGLGSDGFPTDPLDYSIVEWGCLPLPSQRKLMPTPHQVSSQQQQDKTSSAATSRNEAASSGPPLVCVSGLFLLPEFPSPHPHGRRGLGNAQGQGDDAAALAATDAATPHEKKEDTALRLLLVLTRFRHAGGAASALEYIPPSTIDFVAQELNKAMHMLQAELRRRRGPAWYAGWQARSHAQVHRFYAEALAEVQRLLPLPLDVTARTSNLFSARHDANTFARDRLGGGDVVVTPPSMPVGERLPYSPTSRLPREHQQRHYTVAAASSSTISEASPRGPHAGSFPVFPSSTGATAAASPNLTRRGASGQRVVPHRNPNDNLLWDGGEANPGSEEGSHSRSQGGASGGGPGPSGSGGGRFSHWWEKPLSIPSDSALKEKKKHLKEANMTASELAALEDQRRREQLGSGEGDLQGLGREVGASVPVAWDAPPAFIPAVTVDFSSFTTTSLETQLATKKMVADAMAKQQALEDACGSSEQARRNVRRGGVSILSAACRQLLHDELPMLQQYCDWRVIYSTKFHGLSMQTLLKNCQQEAEAFASRGAGGLNAPFANTSAARPMLLVMELSPSVTFDFTADGAGVEAAAQLERDRDWEQEQQHAAAAARARKANRGRTTTTVNAMDPSHPAAPGASCVNTQASPDEDDDDATEKPAGNASRTPALHRMIVGAFLSDLLTMESRRYYGSSDTFVFQLLLPAEIDDGVGDEEPDHTLATKPPAFAQPLLRTYHSTGANNQFINCRLHSIVVGGGGGSAIFLDDSLTKGASSPCATFGSPPLTRFRPEKRKERGAAADPSQSHEESSSAEERDESMASFDVVRLEVIVMD